MVLRKTEATKYVIVGLVLGGILLPALLHPLKITVFASTEDVSSALGALIGISISLLVWRLNSRAKSRVC